MAKPKVEQFTASIRVCAIMDVPVAGRTMEEALANAKALNTSDVLAASNGISDNDQPSVVSVSSSAWL